MLATLKKPLKVNYSKYTFLSITPIDTVKIKINTIITQLINYLVIQIKDQRNISKPSQGISRKKNWLTAIYLSEMIKIWREVSRSSQQSKWINEVFIFGPKRLVQCNQRFCIQKNISNLNDWIKLIYISLPCSALSYLLPSTKIPFFQFYMLLS